MWAQVERVMRQSATQIGDQVANFLPGLLVALLLIVVAVVGAVVVHALLLRALRGRLHSLYAAGGGAYLARAMKHPEGQTNAAEER